MYIILMMECPRPIRICSIDGLETTASKSSLLGGSPPEREIEALLKEIEELRRRTNLELMSNADLLNNNGN
jgi:hypothetical protein